MIDCVTSWLPRWRRNGWRTSARRPVKHQPTIEAIAAELERRPVQLMKQPECQRKRSQMSVVCAA
jgi:ribonuclease HI